MSSVSRWAKFVKKEFSPTDEPKATAVNTQIGTELKEIVIDGVAQLVEVKLFAGDQAPTPKVKCKGGKVRKGPQQIQLPRGVA